MRRNPADPSAGAGVHRREVLVAAALAGLARPSSARAEAERLDWLLDRRRMIRAYRSDPVDEGVVRKLLAAAGRAPSAGHTQPWAFVVVREPGKRKALAHAALDQRFIAEAPVVVVACADLSRSRRRYRVRGERYAIIDTAFASLLFLLAATEEGLGACFVGAFHDAEVKRILSLPETVLPLAVIPVGWPAEKPRELPVRSTRDFVHQESW